MMRSVYAFAQSCQNLHWRISDSNRCKVPSCGQQRLWSDNTNVQARFEYTLYLYVRKYFSRCCSNFCDRGTIKAGLDLVYIMTALILMILLMLPADETTIFNLNKRKP